MRYRVDFLSRRVVAVIYAKGKKRHYFIWLVSYYISHLSSGSFIDKYTGNIWRSRDVLISDVLLWTPTYGRVKAGRPARTYIQQVCEDTGCSPEDLPEAMNDREKWRESQGYLCWKYNMMMMMMMIPFLRVLVQK